MTTTTAPPTRPTVDCQHIADIELPPEFDGLYELAYNLWWVWSARARQLFSSIDGPSWARYHNPVQLLINVTPHQWEELADNDTFGESYTRVMEELRVYRDGAGDSWFARRFPDYSRGPVAYFSMEYGVHQCLAIYSGGLGVLSGDHLKSASDLGVPLVGVGLLYRSGYFHQTVDADGHQQHIFPEYDFTRLPLRPVAGARGRDVIVTVPMPDREVAAKVWLAQVGRIPLLLLDTDIPENDPGDRPITGMLYVQGRAMRLAQECVLGIGGARALAALGIEPEVWHINEGHSALLQLERLRRLQPGSAADLDPGLETVRRTTVFTTHTPVPAGNERFDRSLAARYLSPWPSLLATDADTLLDLGQVDLGNGDSSFNLTALALRTSRYANGVSALHGQVSREMWKPLFATAEPEADDADDPADRTNGGEEETAPTPIHHITNGVHLPTWMGREIREVLRRYLGWDVASELDSDDALERILAIPDAELWQAHLGQKRQLGRFTTARMRDQLARHGRSPEELRGVGELFRPEALTIGFARRFATYKRASLIFSDPHELRRLVSDPDRPLQILFAGKAHPADRPGQELIQHIFQLSQSAPFRGRVFYLEDYDIRVGRMLVQGVDVWLNTPRRPKEASGTSGQKAAINGALNCSILDGWWPEAYDGQNGWSIEAEYSEGADEVQRDLADAQALYQTLAEEIIPTFFDRAGDEPPAGWVARMKRSIATVAPRFASDRMVRDYTEQAYLPEE